MKKGLDRLVLIEQNLVYSVLYGPLNSLVGLLVIVFLKLFTASGMKELILIVLNSTICIGP